MGAVFAKPLTLEDLNNALEPIKQGLLKSEQGMTALVEAFLVPDGDLAARISTVQILQEGSVLGHGLVLVRGAEGATTVATTPTYYLISAAHVLVCVKPHCPIHLHHQSREVLTALTGELYLSPTYVKQGTDDFAALSLCQVRAKPVELVEFKFGLPDVGTGAVAHGRAFLRGTITMIHKNNLFTVLAHSVPGSSGSPVFNNRKVLVGLVHGSTKHRGKHSQDASVVYCYSLLDGKLCPTNLDEKKQRWLEMAEDVPVGLASGSDSLYDVCTRGEANDLKTLASLIQFSIDKDATLDELMEELTSHIWLSLPGENVNFSADWKMATWSH